MAFGHFISKQNAEIPHSVRSVQKRYEYLSGEPDQKISPTKIIEGFGVPLNPEARAPDPTFGSPPLPYWSAALGIRVGAIFECPPLGLFYLGRLFNLLSWVALTYLAIRLTPVFRWTLVALALTPMSVYLAASLSADGFTNASCFLFIAYVFRLSYSNPDKVLQRNQYWILFLLSLPVTFSKFVYMSLVGLFWLIPATRFPSKKNRWLLFFLLAFVNLTIFSWWTYLRGKYGFRAPFPDVSWEAQWTFIKSDPLNFLEILGRTWLTFAKDYWMSFIGNLGWLETTLPDKAYLLFLVIFLLLWVGDREPSWKPRAADRGWSLASFILGILLIFLAQYLTWTPVGSPLIDGVQGRYFIPLSPLPFLAFYPPGALILQLDRLSKYSRYLLPILLTAGLGIAVYQVLVRFYEGL